MNLIDHTYFIGELNLPNTQKQDVQDRLNLFITKYQAKFLNELLGYDLAKQLTTGLTAPTPDTKWTDLRDGKEFIGLNGLMYEWQGLRDNLTKKSIIADYVYYWWMRNEVSQTSAVGEVMTTTENATRTSPSVKMCRAWNEMVNGVWQLVRFLDANRTDYIGWRGAYSYNESYRYNTFSGYQLADIFYPINDFNL